jgi:ParB family chromosome partitioning protein
MTRKALGRGLNALLRTVETPTTSLAQVAIDRIDPNPFQPRRQFPEENLQELAESLKASGLVQPVLLRPADGRYQLIAGERRWRAARLAGLETIPAVVRDVGDQDALELALTENLLREDLNPLDVALGYEALQQKYGLTHEEIADHLGLNRTTVTNTLRLLRLPAEIQEMIRTGEISSGHARALLGLDSAAAQLKLAKLIVRQGLSVRQAEGLVAPASSGASKRGPKEAPRLDPNLRAAILEMERTLGTRVKIQGNEKRGRIEISYFSGEDLNRIYEWIMRR